MSSTDGLTASPAACPASPPATAPTAAPTAPPTGPPTAVPIAAPATPPEVAPAAVPTGCEPGAPVIGSRLAGLSSVFLEPMKIVLRRFESAGAHAESGLSANYRSDARADVGRYPRRGARLRCVGDRPEATRKMSDCQPKH